MCTWRVARPLDHKFTSLVESFTTTFIDKRCPNEPHWTPRRSPPSSLLVFVFIKDVASAHTLGCRRLLLHFTRVRAHGGTSVPPVRRPAPPLLPVPTCAQGHAPLPASSSASHARGMHGARFLFTRLGPPVPLPPSPSVSHTHARPLQQVDPVVTCATPNLLMQHSDKTLATYVRIS